LRRHRADRIEAAPLRGAFPEHWRLNLQARLKGRMVYLRRTDAEGRAEVLGRAFDVDRHWAHRLVRAEVDLDAGVIRFDQLRRREPGDQPLLKEVSIASRPSRSMSDPPGVHAPSSRSRADRDSRSDTNKVRHDLGNLVVRGSKASPKTHRRRRTDALKSAAETAVRKRRNKWGRPPRRASGARGAWAHRSDF
jgi:hypothetical protein